MTLKRILFAQNSDLVEASPNRGFGCNGSPRIERPLAVSDRWSSSGHKFQYPPGVEAVVNRINQVHGIRMV